MAEYGFTLHIKEPSEILSDSGMDGDHHSCHQLKCVCGKQLSFEDALSCLCSGFPSIRHNELHDLTAELLTEACHSVRTEPPLQPLGDEQLRQRTANREDREDCTCLDIIAENFDLPKLYFYGFFTTKLK